MANRVDISLQINADAKQAQQQIEQLADTLRNIRMPSGLGTSVNKEIQKAKEALTEYFSLYSKENKTLADENKMAVMLEKTDEAARRLVQHFEQLGRGDLKNLLPTDILDRFKNAQQVITTLGKDYDRIIGEQNKKKKQQEEVEKNLLNLQIQQKQLEEQRKQLQSKKENLPSSIEDAEKELANRQKKLANLSAIKSKDVQNERTLELIQAQKIVKAYKDNDAIERRGKQQIQIDADTKKIDEINKKTEEYNKQIAETDKQIEEAREAIKNYEQQINELYQTYQKHGGKGGRAEWLAGKSQTAQQARELTPHNEKEIDALNRKKSDLISDKEDLETESQALSKALEQEKTALKEEVDTYEAAAKTVNDLDHEIAEAKKDVDEQTAAVKELKKEYRETNTELEKNSKDTDKNNNAIEQAVTLAAKLLTEYNNLGVASEEAFNKIKEGVEKALDQKLPEGIQNIDQLKEHLNTLRGDQIEKVAKILQELSTTAQGATNSTNQMSEAQRQLVEGLQRTQQEAKRSQNELATLGNRLKYLFSLTSGINILRRAIRGAFNTIQELDQVMTQTAVVSNYTVSDMWKMLPIYTENAKQLGVAISDVYSAQTLYIQQGLDFRNSMQLGIETLKMARIANIDAASATQAMTAALRGFNMELNQTSAKRIDDVYSRLAQITAADTQQISTAMTKTASIAHSANMEFEKTAALLSQIIETTQEAPETAGTALKTIIGRFTEIKKLYSKGELEGTDEEGETIKVNRVSSALSAAGINLNEFFTGAKGLDDIFLELSQKWNDLDIVTQRYIATMAAGSRQQSRFIAMMQDYERTVELVNAAENSQGSSQEQFEKTLDSMQSKLAQLKDTWNEFVMGILNSDLAKKVVDFAQEVITKINKITETGEGLTTMLARVGTIIGSLKLGSLLIKAISKFVLFTGVAKKANMTIGALGASMAAAGQTGSAAIITIGTAAKAAFPILLLIAGAIAAITIAVVQLVKKNRALQGMDFEQQVKASTKAIKELNEELDETKNQLEDLGNARNSLQQLEEDFEKLKVGSKEWRSQLLQINETVLDLIDKYPELASYLSIGENGKLSLSQAGWDKYEEVLNQKIIDLTFTRFAEQGHMYLAKRQNQEEANLQGFAGAIVNPSNTQGSIAMQENAGALASYQKAVEATEAAKSRYETAMQQALQAQKEAVKGKFLSDYVGQLKNEFRENNDINEILETLLGAQGEKGYYSLDELWAQVLDSQAAWFEKGYYPEQIQQLKDQNDFVLPSQLSSKESQLSSVQAELKEKRKRRTALRDVSLKSQWSEYITALSDFDEKYAEIVKGIQKKQYGDKFSSAVFGVLEGRRNTNEEELSSTLESQFFSPIFSKIINKYLEDRGITGIEYNPESIANGPGLENFFKIIGEQFSEQGIPIDEDQITKDVERIFEVAFNKTIEVQKEYTAASDKALTDWLDEQGRFELEYLGKKSELTQSLGKAEGERDLAAQSLFDIDDFDERDFSNIDVFLDQINKINDTYKKITGAVIQYDENTGLYGIHRRTIENGKEFIEPSAFQAGEIRDIIKTYFKIYDKQITDTDREYYSELDNTIRELRTQIRNLEPEQATLETVDPADYMPEEISIDFADISDNTGLAIISDEKLTALDTETQAELAKRWENITSTKEEIAQLSGDISGLEGTEAELLSDIDSLNATIDENNKTIETYKEAQAGLSTAESAYSSTKAAIWAGRARGELLSNEQVRAARNEYNRLQLNKGAQWADLQSREAPTFYIPTIKGLSQEQSKKIIDQYINPIFSYLDQTFGTYASDNYQAKYNAENGKFFIEDWASSGGYAFETFDDFLDSYVSRYEGDDEILINEFKNLLPTIKQIDIPQQVIKGVYEQILSDKTILGDNKELIKLFQKEYGKIDVDFPPEIETLIEQIRAELVRGSNELTLLENQQQAYAKSMIASIASNKNYNNTDAIIGLASNSKILKTVTGKLETYYDKVLRDHNLYNEETGTMVSDPENANAIGYQKLLQDYAIAKGYFYLKGKVYKDSTLEEEITDSAEKMVATLASQEQSEEYTKGLEGLEQFYEKEDSPALRKIIAGLFTEQLGDLTGEQLQIFQNNEGDFENLIKELAEITGESEDTIKSIIEERFGFEKDAYEKSKKQLGQYFEGNEYEKYQEKLKDLTGAEIDQLTSLASVISSQGGSFSKIAASILKAASDVEDVDISQVIKTLLGGDYSSETGVRKLIDDLTDLGLNMGDVTEEIINATNAANKFSLENIKEKLDDFLKFSKSIIDKAKKGERSYTEQEYSTLTGSSQFGIDKKTFVPDGFGGYTYIGDLNQLRFRAQAASIEQTQDTINEFEDTKQAVKVIDKFFEETPEIITKGGEEYLAAYEILKEAYKNQKDIDYDSIIKQFSSEEAAAQFIESIFGQQGELSQGIIGGPQAQLDAFATFLKVNYTAYKSNPNQYDEQIGLLQGSIAPQNLAAQDAYLTASELNISQAELEATGIEDPYSALLQVRLSKGQEQLKDNNDITTFLNGGPNQSQAQSSIFDTLANMFGYRVEDLNFFGLNFSKFFDQLGDDETFKDVLSRAQKGEQEAADQLREIFNNFIIKYFKEILDSDEYSGLDKAAANQISNFARGRYIPLIGSDGSGSYHPITPAESQDYTATPLEQLSDITKDIASVFTAYNENGQAFFTEVGKNLLAQKEGFELTDFIPTTDGWQYVGDQNTDRIITALFQVAAMLGSQIQDDEERRLQAATIAESASDQQLSMLYGLGKQNGFEELADAAYTQMIKRFNEGDFTQGQYNQVFNSGLTQEQSMGMAEDLLTNQQLISERGLNPELVRAQTEELLRLDEAQTLTYESAQGLAIQQITLHQNFSELTSKYNDWMRAISNDNSYKATQAYLEMNEVLTKMFGITGRLSDDFLKTGKNMELFKKAAKKDKDALRELAKEAQKNAFKNLMLDMGHSATNAEYLANEFGNLADQLENLGAAWDDGIIDANDTDAATQNFIANCNRMIAAAGLTEKQVEKMFLAMGYNAKTKTDWVSKEFFIDLPGFDYGIGDGMIHVPPVQEKGEIKYPVTAIESITKDKSFGGNLDLDGGGGGGGGGNKGGGEKKEPWKNTFDRFHNLKEAAGRTERERNKLEREYNNLLQEQSNLLNKDEFHKNLLKQVDALKQQVKYSKDLVEYYDELAKGKTKEAIDWMQQNDDLKKYLKFDEETGEILIDWDEINKITDQDEGSHLEEIYQKLEEFRDAIWEAEDNRDAAIDKQNELIDTLADTYRELREAFISMQDRIRDAIYDTRQKEIDELEEIYKAQDENNSKILDGINEVINEQRQAREQQKQRDELEEKQRKLTLLRQDTSGANQLEILALEKELAESQESYIDSLVDNALEEISNGNQKAQEQRDMQIELLQWMLDYDKEHGAFWDEVTRLMEDAYDEEGNLKRDSELVKLLQGTEEFEALSKFGQDKWWDDLRAEMVKAQEGSNIAKILLTTEKIEHDLAKEDLDTGNGQEYRRDYGSNDDPAHTNSTGGGGSGGSSGGGGSGRGGSGGGETYSDEVTISKYGKQFTGKGTSKKSKADATEKAKIEAEKKAQDYYNEHYIIRNLDGLNADNTMSNEDWERTQAEAERQAREDERQASLDAAVRGGEWTDELTPDEFVTKIRNDAIDEAMNDAKTTIQAIADDTGMGIDQVRALIEDKGEDGLQALMMLNETSIDLSDEEQKLLVEQIKTERENATKNAQQLSVISEDFDTTNEKLKALGAVMNAVKDATSGRQGSYTDSTGKKHTWTFTGADAGVNYENALLAKIKEVENQIKNARQVATTPSTPSTPGKKDDDDKNPKPPKTPAQIKKEAQEEAEKKKKEKERNNRGPNKMEKFDTGGYTGDWHTSDGKLAILHQKELILNAQDTANFIQLRDILRDMDIGNPNTGVTNYEIHIEVDEISSDYDVERLADKVKDMIVEESEYRNVNQINTTR